ncbi:glycosyltransferase [Pigmentiphaga soli]|uniref:Glycosyltransferase n=1 Tax=Pigmentiphaga soli TaxID=1007095 RepID=A0ABP8GGF6_9BURK
MSTPARLHDTRGPEAFVPASMPIQASIVVPTYRRPDMLTRCLLALLGQDFEGGYEIVVADDGPDDDTRAAVEQIAARAAAEDGPQVRYLPVTGTQGPSAARNRGWEIARAPVIAFTDDDTIPEPDWLRRGCHALATGAAAAVGRIVVPLPPRPTDYEVDASGLARAEFATANCFVTRSALETVGGFDERFTMAWREDSDLQFMLLEAGLPVVRANDAVVLHPVRPARRGISVSQQRKVFFDALLYKKHPRLYRMRIRPRPPWHYVAIVAGLLAAVAGAVAGLPWLAGLGLAVWAVLTLAFCLRRLRNTSRSPAHVAEMLLTSVLIPPLALFWRLRGAWHFRVGFL